MHLHAEQKRKGTTIPYIAHLLAVTAIVLEDGGNEDEAIAALLHDAIEDQGGDVTRQEIRRFGEKVVAIVDGCTDAETMPKPPWMERKKQDLEHLRHAAPEVLRVSAADKLHNARAVLADFRRHGNAVWECFNGGREGTLWYYRRLVQVFREAGPSFLVEELDRVVSELERLAGITC